MPLSTRIITWSVLGIDGTPAFGTITIQPSVPQVVDVTNNVTYVQNTLTYPVQAGQSVPIITTDNVGTNPVAGAWGYNITLQLAPGVPDISVQNVQIVAGGTPITLAAIFNAAGL